eukprot:gnl/TRDRNA2_/TRDRNA2_140463_c0_seq2.p1 gnl/TRDRNA2_/TRDRNA2_140463_c0~~gnl/TRDRNA2_/TRDRNA2_140463_c0_seq2.p1  ORF type:complete len:114 (+),score=8.19 gnl/TRDRNA2_/TRDRNA2_140463_c0_seq2:113-454(+)
MSCWLRSDCGRSCCIESIHDAEICVCGLAICQQAGSGEGSCYGVVVGIVGAAIRFHSVVHRGLDTKSFGRGRQGFEASIRLLRCHRMHVNTLMHGAMFCGTSMFDRACWKGSM